MKILVCISKVPDTTSKITFKDGDSKFKTDNIQFIVNPYDEWYALVRGLEIKEALGGSVSIIHVGLAENDPIIRKALAIGADNAIRINAEAKDSYYTAFQIAAHAREESYDLILVGKETIDFNGSAIGAMLSQMLDMPFESMCSNLQIDGNTLTVEREIEGGKEISEIDLPCVVSAKKDLAEQRIPNMRGIMAARSKPLQVLEAQDCEALTHIEKFELLPEKGACKYIDAEHPEELLNLLHNEAKVI